MQHENLWAPWRLTYLRELDRLAKELGETDFAPEDFLASYWRQPELDQQHHVVYRNGHGIILLNLFPYSNGHLLTALGEPRPSLLDYSADQRRAFWELVEIAMDLMQQTIGPQGINMGINQGRAAGAGLLGHLHAHLVPRWSADTNFITVVGDIRVIPDALRTMADQYRETARAMRSNEAS